MKIVLLLALCRDNAVYLSFQFTEPQQALIGAAIEAGLLRVVATRYTVTDAGLTLLEREK